MTQPYSFDIDRQFVNYFQGRLKQVFLYITDKCNILCKQCLYKPNVLFQLGKGEIELETALSLVSDFRKMGATKMNILGGEPSLYGRTQNHKPLIKVIETCKDLGYRSVRIDTNGIFAHDFLTTPGLKNLDEMAFSLDGHTPETNDMMRGEGNFTRTVESIKRAVHLGFNVTITTCVHRKLVEVESNGRYMLDSMIRFAESLQVNEINFHVLFKYGFPMDTWTGDADIPWYTWVKVYEDIHARIQENEYKIQVRIPQHFVTKEEFDRNPGYYGYCPAKLGERVLVHPDGIIRICAGLLSSQYGIARYNAYRIIWEDSWLNELRDHKLNEFTPCTHQSKNMECGGMLPLCFSFKPEQKEVVWNEELNWESRKRL